MLHEATPELSDSPYALLRILIEPAHLYLRQFWIEKLVNL